MCFESEILAILAIRLNSRTLLSKPVHSLPHGLRKKSQVEKTGLPQMTTPKREMIIQRATEIWYEDCFKSGIMNPNTPEIEELKECGAWHKP
jgi:hypothetical protein